jgi:hypothetical protein
MDKTHKAEELHKGFHPYPSAGSSAGTLPTPLNRDSQRNTRSRKPFKQETVQAARRFAKQKPGSPDENKQAFTLPGLCHCSPGTRGMM